MGSFQRMVVSDVMDLSVMLEGEELSPLVFRVGLPMVAVFCENHLTRRFRAPINAAATANHPGGVFA